MNEHRPIAQRTHTTHELHCKTGAIPGFHFYSLLIRRAPAEYDIQKYFRASAPTVHQMIVTLDRKGFISRTPGQNPPMNEKLTLPRGKVGRIDSQSGVAYTFNGAEAMDLVSLNAVNRTITDHLRPGHKVSRICNRAQL